MAFIFSNLATHSKYFMMRKLIFCISVILFFSCNETNKNSENNSNNSGINSENSTVSEAKNELFERQIIPGKRLGTILLDENATRVLDSLGEPDSDDAAMGKAVATWKNGDNSLLSIYTSTQMGVEDFSRIKAIRSLSKDFKTVDNLGVSSAIDQLKRYYRLDPAGKFTYNGKHYYLYTTNKGIAFEIGMDQKCHGILLYNQATDPETFYLPLYSHFEKL